MHKCQGMAQLLALPGPAPATFQLVESTFPGDRRRTSSRCSTASTLDRRARPLCRRRPPRELHDGLAAISTAVQKAQKAFDAGRRRNRWRRSWPVSGRCAAPRARSSMPDRRAGASRSSSGLRQKEREFQQAICLAEQRAGSRRWLDDGVACQPGTAGQPLDDRRQPWRGRRGRQAGQVRRLRRLRPMRVGRTSDGGTRGGRWPRPRRAAPPAGAALSTLQEGPGGPLRADADAIPPNAAYSEPYWHREGEAEALYTVSIADAPFGLPFRPTPFYVQVTLRDPAPAPEVIDGLPVQSPLRGRHLQRREAVGASSSSPPSRCGSRRRVSDRAGVSVHRRRRPGSAPDAHAVARHRRTGAPSPRRPSRPAQPAAGTAAAAPRSTLLLPPATAAATRRPRARDSRHRPQRHDRAPAETSVKLDLPQGWSATPAAAGEVHARRRIADRALPR